MNEGRRNPWKQKIIYQENTMKAVEVRGNTKSRKIKKPMKRNEGNTK